MKSKLKETMRYYKFLCPKPVRKLFTKPIEATAEQQPFDYDLFVRAEHPLQINAATSAEFFVEAFYDVVNFYVEAGLSVAVQQGLINQLHEVLDPWLDSVELMGGE